MKNCVTGFYLSVLIKVIIFVLLLYNRIVICNEVVRCADRTGVLDCSYRRVLTSEENGNLPLSFSCFLCCYSEMCCERNGTIRMQLSTNRVKYLGFCSFLIAFNNDEGNSTRSTDDTSTDPLSRMFIGFNGSNNEITEIPCFVKWSVLEWVDLSNNNIFTIVRRLYFGKGSSLKTLILRNNQIHVILPYVFSRLNHLKYLSLNNNPCVDDWSFLQTSSDLLLVDYRGIDNLSCFNPTLCYSCRNSTTVILNKIALIEYESKCVEHKALCSFVSEWPARIHTLTTGSPLELCIGEDDGLTTVFSTDNNESKASEPKTTEPALTSAFKNWVLLLFVLVFIGVLLLVLARCIQKRKNWFLGYGQFYSRLIIREDIEMEESCKEIYYSTIPENVTQGKIFSEKDMHLIVCLKNGHIYNRWMGTITSDDVNRCVVLSTVVQYASTSKTVNWDDFVRKSLELPKNKHLATIEGISFKNESLFLIQEHLNCETLHERLKRGMGSSASAAAEIMMTASEVMRHVLGILEGLELLHSYGFLHPGLSTKKVLLTNKGICKLYDFCLNDDAKSITTTKKSQMTCGMNQFAPEVLHESEYTKASDVWSTGVVIWEILSGHAPFGLDDQTTTGEESSKTWPEEYKSIRNSRLFDCWQLECSLRPSVQELRSSFMKIFQSVLNESPDALPKNVTEGYIPMNTIIDRICNE